jgi:hypothetical protein
VSGATKPVAGTSGGGGKSAAVGGSPAKPPAAGSSAAPSGGTASAAGKGAGGAGGKSDDAIDAGTGEDACTLACAAGTSCVLMKVTCVRAPCPGIPMCVDDVGALPDAGTAVNDCDPRKITCKSAVPICPEGQAPSVAGSCYGPCVPVESCGCSEPQACPLPDSYTCHNFARHCGPFV